MKRGPAYSVRKTWGEEGMSPWGQRGGEIARAEGLGTHRHPADLGSQVPEVECGRGAHGQLLQDILIL